MTTWNGFDSAYASCVKAGSSKPSVHEKDQQDVASVTRYIHCVGLTACATDDAVEGFKYFQFTTVDEGVDLVERERVVMCSTCEPVLAIDQPRIDVLDSRSDSTVPLLAGTGKGKKRSAYTDDGWQCDSCLGSQTSLRRNGPNGQRMCTACYSKMQRERKKGEAGFCDRPPVQEPEADSQLSVRGARPASAAARKFIEEFARNKGASETASARQDPSARRETDAEAPSKSQTAAYGAALLLGTAPTVMTEGLFAKAQFGVGIAGAHILQRDPILASSRTMRYMTDTFSAGHGDEIRSSRNLSPGDGPYPLAAPWTEYQARHLTKEDPTVLQGASNLMLLTQKSSPRENLSDSKQCTPTDSGPGNVAVNSAPQMTVGTVRMALTLDGLETSDEPAEKHVSSLCGMKMCAEHLPGARALPVESYPQENIPAFHTLSAPAMLAAKGMRGGSAQLWEGSVASSSMAAATLELQQRQQSDPCALPSHRKMFRTEQFDRCFPL